MEAATRRRSLVVKVTVGEDARERCGEGFTVAAAAASAGADVSLWLSGEAVWLATPGRAAGFDLPHSAPLDGILDLLLG
jgi:predicted peroxiredoxin